MTTIHDILEEFRQEAESKRDLGDRFERLMQAYFKTDPYYQDLFCDVWLWMEYPKRGDAPDTGIDLVAEERATGELWAIQCKFYGSKHTLSKADLDSFFTASGKKEFTHRLIVATTDNWSDNLEKAIQNQQIPVNRLTVYDLANSPIDWSLFSLSSKYAEDRLSSRKVRDTTGIYGLRRTPKKQLRPHQILALERVTDGLRQADRGKLIMACGTGKTFTALKIAEQMAGAGKQVLFLVPSISLLSQTLREWTAEAEIPIHPIAVCSDVKVGKKSNAEDIKTSDLPFPATTDSQKVAQGAKLAGDKMTVIFSTYQSIEAIASAQKQGLPEFDLIICDEAHRTTGVILADKEESQFTRVHNQEYVKGKKRLYMTATPRLYGDQAKTKAQENDFTLCSMDDESLYGKELHRLGFGEAVSSGLLSDYRVLVLAVDEKYVSRTFQRQLAEGAELKLEDAVKIVGCWNGLAKKIKAQEEEAQEDPQPMRRAVAFSRSIKDSQTITQLFGQIIDEYKQNHLDEEVLDCALQHIDGTQNSLERNRKLDWLKAESPQNSCRILSNARCLSEGVDVPALDAVMFLTPRNSQVDVVQSVGRVMRKAEGKKYGYIILPIGIPADMTPEEALKDNDRYRVVWQVLQALRAHDDRFNAIINKLELNNNPPPQVDVIGVGGGKDDSENVDNKTERTVTQLKLNLPQLEEWKQAIYAKIVVKCGDRRYWEEWAKDVAIIADQHTSRIRGILARSAQIREQFNRFVASLQAIINPSIQDNDAIEMLSQHLITKPVFDAIFSDYEFTKCNPISVAMQKMIDVLEGQSLAKETEKLDKFYASVKNRASGIDNAQGRQKVIVELYDKFFKLAFPKMAERLGIVYTPVEIVDFIVHSADAALKQEFGVGLTDKNVCILDPFTGTGTFIVRTLQSGLIKPEDLPHKYTKELHANEILLLAYYIAAVNIETAYHGVLATGEYQPFDGIVLTDTFQMNENDGTFNEDFFPENNQRVIAQKQNKIQVIISNPPYSAGQKSENDSNKNLKYARLDQRIADSYARYSTATNKNSLYDSYIRAIRWAVDRIGDRGVICFVTNGSFIDNNAMDGLRKCLFEDFTSIYVFNLRGNQRTSGEVSRKEGGKIFGSGSRASIAITLLIRNPDKAENMLYYHDIGDYLSREEKLSIIEKFGNFTTIDWERLTPNAKHDWINARNPEFETFISLGDKTDKSSKSIFDLYSNGVKTNRDNWVYNFSRQALTDKMTAMIQFYNSEVERFRQYLQGKSISSASERQQRVESFINTDSKSISWSRGLKNDLGRLVNHSFSDPSVVVGMYRPYCKQVSYFNREFNDMVYQQPKIFPATGLENLVICVTGIGAGKEFSALIVDAIPNLHLQDTGQCFPLYTYEKVEATDQTSFLETQTGYVKKENIPDQILSDFQQIYSDSAITKEDIFYYVYGILHSTEYKTRFASDLKKMLPRIPYAADFWAFSKAGRALANWHIHYETIEPYPLEESQSQLNLDSRSFYRVQKMSFGKNAREVDKTTIIYNSNVKLTGIPLEAYQYKVCDRSAIEWIMERYQVTVDKDSQIRNDPNDWSDDPRYIVDLLKRIVRVSLETVKIVNSLPPLNER